MPLPRTDALLAALREALQAQQPAWAHTDLELLLAKGLAHDHVRLGSTGLLARVPKQSQLGLDALSNLTYQRACFERAAPSGHTPHCVACIAPTRGLPRGALVVDEIVGRPAALPSDLPGVARALAAVHALPVAPQAERAPLFAPADPLALLWQEIQAQAVHLDALPWSDATRCAVDRELARLDALLARPERPGIHLIAFDAHPGNYIARPDGRIFLVDLEKCRYSYPGLDLAHATLYTSTTWEAASNAVLQVEDVLAFHAQWEQCVGRLRAVEARPWHAPLRRAMWLWSLTWCAKWLHASRSAPDASARGEDWSAETCGDALVAHVRERVHHYLSPHVIALVRSEIAALQEAFA